MGDERDIETPINLTCLMVQNAVRLWWEMDDINPRQRLQSALFPDGLIYSQEEGFGPAENRYPDKDVPGVQRRKIKNGTPTGIRTPVAGMKILCPRPLDDGGVKRREWRFL